MQIIIRSYLRQSLLIYFLKTYTETPECFHGCKATSSPIPEGKIEPSPTIVPTDTIKENQNNENKGSGEEDDDDFFDADRQFWLVTVLKSDGKDPIITDLKNSLAKLYKTAFQR